MPAIVSTVSTETDTDMLDAALAYAARGWPIFPLAARTKTPLKGSHGYKDATADLATVERWWQDHPDANIALATDTLAVLDVDPRNGGHLTLEALEAEHGPLPHTVESITGSGGRHIFFRLPSVPIRRGSHALGAGLDVKSGGPYVVLPPSVHPNGRAYEWELSSLPGDVGVADMPAWMVERLDKQNTISTPSPRGTTLGVVMVQLPTESKRAELDLALARLLGIDRPVGAKFCCLLHPEKHPSAWLFWGKSGDLLYHCEHHGGHNLTLPALRASLLRGRVARLQGVEHYIHRVCPLVAAGVLTIEEVLHMPLPEDAPKAAKAWYKAFVWMVSFKKLAHPEDSAIAFSRRFAIMMTGLSEADEQKAARWLMRQGYVQANGTYRAYGKDCNLLELGFGPAFEGFEGFAGEGEADGTAA